MIARLSSIGRVNGKEMCINIYDVRLDDTKPDCGMNWQTDIKNITPYLEVRVFIGFDWHLAHSSISGPMS